MKLMPPGRQALVDAHGAAVLALKQEPNQPGVGGVYFNVPNKYALISVWLWNFKDGGS